MEYYEHEKWINELKECVLGISGEGVKSWEGILSNLGVFFLQYGRQDIARLLWEFSCQYGEVSQMAAFNLASHHLFLAQQVVETGLNMKPQPVDLSELKDGAIHPDLMINKLGVWKDMLENAWK